MKKPELLAPTGDFEKLRTAIHYGADAVYLGDSRFSFRGYTTGMFFGKQPDSDYNFDGKSYRMSHELVGIILEIKNSIAKVKLRNRLDKGDTVEYLSPGLEEKLKAFRILWQYGLKTIFVKYRKIVQQCRQSFQNLIYNPHNLPVNISNAL